MKISAVVYAGSILALMVLTQNCAPPQDLEGQINEVRSAEESRYRDLSRADLESELQNDDASIENFVNDEENQAREQVSERTKCTFHLRGRNGAEWFVERYTNVFSNCRRNQIEVNKNNPNAIIFRNVQNYVHDDTGRDEKIKCRYILRGSQGAQWFTERYIHLGQSCLDAELDKVVQNNPLAQIVDVASNYVHDSVRSVHKTKCTFHLRGQKGAEWFVERYISAVDASCETHELPTVKQNNPKAVVTKIISNYVYDPFSRL